ncbi:hypothetical protein FACS1894104_1650 [Actinomycetota bacterium]|nr:hypothetical protein FACS1894104_1650 [Actinomycetota bacterium]
MDKKVADFMIFITEKIAQHFFDGDSARAYDLMQSTGFWDFLTSTYSTSHTLSVEYLLEDATEWFLKSGVEL